MFRREQQWTAAEEAALGVDPILREPTAGMPPGWAGMGNAERAAHAMRVRAAGAGGAQQVPAAAPAVNGAPHLDQARQQVQVFDHAFREAVTTDAPQFRQAVAGRHAHPARVVLDRMIGRVRAIENAVALGCAYATADPALGEQDRGRQAEVLTELSRGDQLLRGISGVLLPVVAPAAYLKHSAGALPAASATDAASVILAAGDGTVRALQTADGIRAILGGDPAATTDVQRRLASALVVTQPQGAAEAALLREILAERGLATLSPDAPPAVDMFDLYAGMTGELIGGPAGRTVLPAFLEQSGAKQVAHDVVASIYWSSGHAPAVFGDWWQDIEDDWPIIIGTVVGFLAAEVLSVVLLASPHPAAQMAGAAIQAALLAVMVLGAGLELVQMMGEVVAWLTLCRDAGGDPTRIQAASQAFCRVMLRALSALAAALGARGAAALKARLPRLRDRVPATVEDTPAPPAGVGAMKRNEYEPAPYHGRVNQGGKSKGPTNGQDALDSSLQVKDTSPRRVGIDYATEEFVVFDQTSPGIFHGHVREWADLTDEMRKVLIDAGMANRKGKILVGDER
jgi:hypothetical protein